MIICWFAPLSYSVITGGLVSNDSTNATAVATSGSAMCVPAAMMLCNPNEPLTGSTGVVQLYSDYEQRLADAISHNDSKQINQLVADDFEMRPANDIGIPTPRADWISQSLKESPVSISIGQMAVHEYGNIRIVSFLMKRTKPGSPECGSAVVDVWTLSGENSILKVRYAALPGSASVRAPGEVRQRLRKKY